MAAESPAGSRSDVTVDFGCGTWGACAEGEAAFAVVGACMGPRAVRTAAVDL